MKTFNPKYLTTIFVIGLLSCHSDLELNDSNVENKVATENSIARIAESNLINQSMPADLVDASGKVHIMVWWTVTEENNINSLAVPIGDPDYVLVGGIADAIGYGAGALLTESRPDFQNNSWIASSKAHIVSDPHVLVVGAIGMKLDGVSASVLRSRMTVVTSTSSVASHPSTSATLPIGYTIIGGGAKINWSGWGNLLVGSYPSSMNSWYAIGKDHKKSSPASITAYAIGIQNSSIPNFGTLAIGIDSQTGPFISSGWYAGPNFYSPVGTVVTCPGGLANYSGYGRMLATIRSSHNVPNNAYIYTKDHLSPSSGTNTVYTISAQKL